MTEIKYFYALKREQARQLLNHAIPTLQTMTICEMKKAQGIYRLATQEGYDVWLFPEQNPDYQTGRPARV